MMLSDLFNVEYPPTLIFSQQIPNKNGINFVSSSGKNNGIVSKVRYNPKAKLYPPGVITVPLKGSVLSAFVQPEECYVAHQIAILTPKKEISLEEKIYYCMCIRKNRYRYNYGRQADRTLKNIELPKSVPKNITQLNIPNYEGIDEPLLKSNLTLDTKSWRSFEYQDLFTIVRGQGARKTDVRADSNTPFITSIDSNNGLTGYVKKSPVHPGNVITVNRNGSVGEAFYQHRPFCSTEDVHVFNPINFDLNLYIGLFLTSLILKERFRYSFGRKWGIERMKKTKIRLPVDKRGKPDWNFMERYMKNLPYSTALV